MKVRSERQEEAKIWENRGQNVTGKQGETERKKTGR